MSVCGVIRGWVDASCCEADQKPKGKKEPPVGWETKQCACCQCTPTQPSAFDTIESKQFRRWNGPNFWGNLCYWCVRMASIKLAWLSIPQFQKHIDQSDGNKVECRLAAFAYLTLRVEGKTMLSAQQIDDRVDMLLVAMPVLKAIAEDHHESTFLLESFVEQFPAENPIQKGFVIVEMMFNSQRRLGVRASRPIDCNSAPKVKNCVAISPFVRSDKPDDWALLDNLTAKFAASMVEGNGAASSGSGLQPSPAKSRRSEQFAEPDGSWEAESQANGGDVDDDQPAQLCFPKGRLGTGVSKMQKKVEALVGALLGPKWREAAKDSSVRALIRSAAGTKEELQSSEFPALVDTNQNHLTILNALLELSVADAKFRKDEQTSNLLKFLAPIETLSTAAIAIRPSARLDAELLLMKAVLCQ